MQIQLHTCKTCKVRIFREYNVVRVDTYGPGGMYTKNVYGRTNEFGREVLSQSDTIGCPKCQAPMARVFIQGRKTDTPCDERCTEAKGHKCECSCGGRNHGRAA